VDRFVAYPRTLCFVLNGDDVLLLKGAPGKRLYANQYNGVGGHVERGEDILAGLLREVREETGLEIKHPTLRAVIVADEGSGPGVVIFVYTAMSASRSVRPSAEGELVWAPRARLLDYDLVPDLRELLPRLLAALPDCIIYGHYGADGVRLQESAALELPGRMHGPPQRARSVRR
jgi:8-oxo-dGTP diphosphatase